MSGDGLNNPAAIDTLALEATLEDVGEDVTAIREVTDVEPVLEETGGTITTDATEQTIYINSTTLASLPTQRPAPPFGREIGRASCRERVLFEV